MSERERDREREREREEQGSLQFKLSAIWQLIIAKSYSTNFNLNTRLRPVLLKYKKMLVASLILYLTCGIKMVDAIFYDNAL